MIQFFQILCVIQHWRGKIRLPRINRNEKGFKTGLKTGILELLVKQYISQQHTCISPLGCFPSEKKENLLMYLSPTNFVSEIPYNDCTINIYTNQYSHYTANMDLTRVPCNHKLYNLHMLKITNFDISTLWTGAS